MDYRALSSELNKGTVAPCYLFIAYDRYIAKAYVRQIRGMILTGELADMNCRVFDDKRWTPGYCPRSWAPCPSWRKRGWW